MQVLQELITGTIPSHRLFATLNLELFGIVFEIKDHVYAGQHTQRLLFKQQLKLFSLTNVDDVTKI